MRKIILGLVATAAIAAPLAVAGTANAASAPAPAKATGTVAWSYTANETTTTGTVVFVANDKTGGTLDYTDSTGQTIHGVISVEDTVVKTGSKVTFTGTVTDSNYAPNVGDPFTGVVIDGGTSGNGVDQIGLFVDRSVDDNLAGVTSGNLTVF